MYLLQPITHYEIYLNFNIAHAVYMYICISDNYKITIT